MLGSASVSSTLLEGIEQMTRVGVSLAVLCDDSGHGF